MTRLFRSIPVTRLRALHERARAEDGFTLIEVMASLTILTFGFLALAGAASTGARLVAEGKQRQAAAEIGSRQLEHLRNVPYAQLALQTGPVHSPDPDNPDHFVSADGVSYDHRGNGAWEPLLVASGGGVAHIENFTVGSTSLTAFHYVTWVDDPDITGTEDYKRLTVVVRYNTPVNTGRPTQVRASGLITDGSVSVTGTSVGAGNGQLASPSPTPTPTPSGSCSGDTQAPTGNYELRSGTGAAVGYTASTTVTIAMTPSDACLPIRIRFSNDGVAFGERIIYDPTNPTTNWRLTDGDGAKTVWARFTDGVGNQRTLGPKTIVVDGTPPSAPGTLTRSVTCTGDDRTVALSWGAATDANLLGYRVYRSIDGGVWESVATSSTTTETNRHKKTLDSVRFRVVAYDRAGNEGGPTNAIALARAQCS